MKMRLADGRGVHTYDSFPLSLPRPPAPSPTVASVPHTHAHREVINQPSCPQPTATVARRVGPKVRPRRSVRDLDEIDRGLLRESGGSASLSGTTSSDICRKDTGLATIQFIKHTAALWGWSRSGDPFLCDSAFRTAGNKEGVERSQLGSSTEGREVHNSDLDTAAQ